MKIKKRGRGRPNLGNDARQIAVIVKITANERTAWRKLAEEAGMPLGPWLIEPRRNDLRKEN